MARNHNFHYDDQGIPRAGGPANEKPLMQFLESDIQGSDSLCRALMDDIEAIGDGSDDEREFIGNVHSATMSTAGVIIERLADDAVPDEQYPYKLPLKQFREVVEDWEVFIMDDQFDDITLDDEFSDDDYA
ncbi:MAG: hypothetical protein CSA54_06240 [Gammaproteobacteria bacterium]|nr:MAG: hypothetical protein CSA54_06240 [Gammaproteobacteria bacterium]